MKIALVSIGDELLKGQIVNTNSTFLGKRLSQEGFSPFIQITLPDQFDALYANLKDLLSSYDLILATGGLGPTLDDVTRKVACALFQCELQENQMVKEDLEKRYPLEKQFAVQDQAFVPSKASCFLNPIGSAPGLVLEEKGKKIVFLPGVPQEMEGLFEQAILPWMKKQKQEKSKESRFLHFCFLYESILDPPLRELSLSFPSVQVGIYPAYGTVTVVLSSENQKELSQFEEGLTDHFSSYRYFSPSGSLSEALLLSCMKHEKKIALAESCTGGSLASEITLQPHASHYFLGSLVTYSNEAKQKWLHVSSHTLTNKGSVSKETVLEMLAGVFATSQADIALAVSGIAGPTGGSGEVPVGTFWVAIGERGEAPEASSLFFTGDRKKRIQSATLSLLGALWKKVEKRGLVFPLMDLKKGGAYGMDRGKN